MSLGSETSFFEDYGFSSCLFIFCFYLSSSIFLYSLLVPCLHMYTWKLLCSLLDGFVVFKNFNEDVLRLKLKFEMVL